MLVRCAGGDLGQAGHASRGRERVGVERPLLEDTPEAVALAVAAEPLDVEDLGLARHGPAGQAAGDDLGVGRHVRGHAVVLLSAAGTEAEAGEDRKSTRLNSSHANISYAVFC